MRSELSTLYRFAELLTEPLRNGIYKTKEHHGHGVKVVNMGELFGHPRLSDVPMKRLELTEAELSKSSLKEGDLLFARRSLVASGAGKCTIVKKIVEATTFESSIIRARPNASLADSDYLYYFFASPQGKELMGTILRQVAVSGITGSDLAELKIPLPNLNEQRRRASVLQALDDRITLLSETNITLEAIAQALFKSWFVDFDPVHAKMLGRTPEGMDDATASLFPDSFGDSELGVVPQGWRIHAVGELLAPKRGKSITRSKCIDGDIPVVAGGLAPAYFHNQSNVSNPVITISASGANAGFVRLYQQDIWASDCSFVNKDQTDSIYFWYVFLKSNQENIYFMQQGAAQPHIYPSDLMRLNICTPKTNELINLFHNFVAPLFERIGIANAKIQNLSRLRDTLLSRLISGQLNIADAEEALI